MGMFDKYDNLSPDYIPNNSSLKTVETSNKFDNTLPIAVYNKKNELIGYAFNEGDNIVLDTGLSLTIKVEPNAIIYTEVGAYPDTNTEGCKGQRAYNIVDGSSYTCVSISAVSPIQNSYIWTADKVFTTPHRGTQIVELTPYSSYSNAVASIVNFRGDVVVEFDISCTAKTISIDKDTSNLLKQGVYYLEVYVSTITQRRQVTRYKLIVTNKDGRNI